MDRFSICLPYTLAAECPDPDNWSNPANFSNDPRDPGGATQCGITQAELNAWRRAHGETYEDVRNMPRDEGTAIYASGYWEPHCNFLAPGLDLSVFDTDVVQGPSKSIRILQIVLGAHVDGVWGPETETAATAATLNVPATILAFTAARKVAFRNTRNFSVFGNGWINRATNIGADALSMTKVPEGTKKLREFVRTPRAYDGYGRMGVTIPMEPKHGQP